MSKIPKLRFKEFSEDWKEKKLSELGSFKNGLNKSKEDFGFGHPFVNLMDVFGKDVVFNEDFGLVNANEKDLKLYNLIKGDVLFIRSSVKKEGVGLTSLITKDLLDTTYSGFLIRFRDNMKDLDFLFKKYCFKTKKFRNNLMSLSTTSANTNINQESLNILKLNLPQKQEQEKIASFLTSVDTKIEQITKKESLLKEYKKGVMQKIFNQEIRFVSDDGTEFCDWEEKKLSQIAIKKNTKNKDDSINRVLTNSAVQGIVNQQDYFDKDIANQNNLEGYYIVEKDNFIYNPRISSFAPVGPIKRNKIGQGVMSPLYTVLELENDCRNFYEYYFETALWHKYMNQIANFGARHDRMNITNNDFMKMPLPFPCIEEQNKIVNFLSSIDGKIEQTQKQLKETQDFKKALLQQMFV